MSKYTQPGDADAMRILQAEYAQEQRDLESVRKKLDAGGVSANDAANLQMEVVRRRENLRTLEREMQNWTKRTGVSQSASVQPTPASPPSSARISVSGPAAAIPSAPAAGGIGEYVTGIIRNQMERQDAAIKAQQEGVTKSSQADAAVTMANNDRSAAINSNRLLVQAQAGLGPQAKEDMYAATMAKLAENNQKYAAARANYDKYATVNVMEDPLGWLWAQLNIDAAGAQVNQLAAQENILTAALERNMLLSERAETTIQIDTRENDRQIADFQARKQLADGAAKVAALEAEGARASMSAAAVYGGELRKDNKTASERTQDQLQQMVLEERLKTLQAERDVRDRVSQFTGSATPEKAMDNMPPADKAEVQNFASGGSTSPRIIVQYGQGLKTTPLYDTSTKLQDLVSSEIKTYASNRGSGNPVLAGKITWKPTDDQTVAWNEVRAVLQASNANRDAKTAVTLTDPRWDKQYNPLRGEHFAFVDMVRKAAAVGAPTPVHPANVVVQLYDKISKVPGARNKDTGQVTTEVERNAVLGGIANMAIEGRVVGADGKPLTPDQYAAMISNYYAAQVSWNQNRNELQRLGFQDQKGYLASVPTRELDDKKAVSIVDLTNKTEVRRWLEQQVKINAAQKLQQELQQKLFEQIGELPPVRF